ncbi:MAG: S8 family serine peptidase [Armatimonadota bacterium]
MRMVASLAVLPRRTRATVRCCLTARAQRRSAFLLVTLAVALGVGTGPALAQPMRLNPPEPVIQFPAPALGLQLVESTQLIRAGEARAKFGVDGSGLTVAVIDTGLRVTHVDFAGRVVARANCTGSGASDDVTDGEGHGTNVTGIIAANGDHRGIAPGAGVIPLRVFDASGQGYSSWTEAALQWVVAHRSQYNITVVNMSLAADVGYQMVSPPSGWDCNDEIAQLRAAGVAVVAGAGNDFYKYGSEQGMSYPAILAESISAGAVYDANISGPWGYGSGAQAYSTGADRLCPFSNRLSSTVGGVYRTDVFAPGAALRSAGIANDHGESTMHGTSQATPVVAGVVLLMQQHYRNLHGSLPSVDQIEAWLRSTAVTINDGDDEDDNVVNTGQNFPRVDALAALTAIGAPGVIRPDLLARNQGDQAWIGDNTYSGGGDQKRAQTVAAGAVARYELRLQNDGTRVDRCRLRATTSAGGASAAVYTGHSGGSDITGAVMGSGWLSGELAPGASIDLRVEVTPDAALSSPYQVRLTSTSVTDSTKTDAVLTETSRRVVSYQPDAQVRAPADVSYLGDGLYNSDGHSQTRAQATRPGAAAVYEIKVENDATADDSFTVTAALPPAGWQAVFFDALSGGADITAQVTGAGWSTGALAAGAARELRLEVTPGTTVADNEEFVQLVTATSARDPARVDAVGAATEKLPDPAGDAYEPDDTPAEATPIATDGTRQQHTIHVGGDSDWVSFSAAADHRYRIETFVGSADTYLTLYAADGTSVLGYNDDREASDDSSEILWTAPAAGTYYAMVRHYDARSGTGDYELAVTDLHGTIGPDGYEPDDVATDANQIQTRVGGRQLHTFHVGGDQDWLYFDASRNTTYVIETEVGSADTCLCLFDVDGTSLLDENDDYQGRASRIEWLCRAGGQYYVMVRERDAQHGTGDYIISIESMSAHTPDQYEVDDSAAEAGRIDTDGGRQQHSFHTTRDYDWVSFEGVAGLRYDVQTWVSLGTDTIINLYGTDAQTVLDSNDDKGSDLGSRIIWDCPADGVYYVEVWEYDGSFGAYEIAISGTAAVQGDAYEPDNSSAEATLIATDGTRQEHDFHVGGDVDWLCFDAGAGDRYRLKTALGSADTCIFLYGTDAATLLAHNDDRVPSYVGPGLADYSSEIVWDCPADGRYYVKVRDSDATRGTGSYEVWVQGREPDTVQLSFGAGVRMISIPIGPLDPDPAQIGANAWARWNTTAAGYRYYSTDTEQWCWFHDAEDVPGHGYWARFTAPRQVEVAGRLPDPRGFFPVTLRPGWNQIGCPWEVTWQSDGFPGVHQGMFGYTLAQAREAGICEDFAWGYDPARGYELVYDQSLIPAARGKLQVPQGYWVRAYQDCQLLLPPSATAAVAGDSEARAEFKPGEWVLAIIADAGTGVRSQAVLGHATLARGMEAPPSAGEGAQLHILAEGVRRGLDITDAQAPLRWTLEATTALPDATVTLTWPDLSGLPAELRPMLVDLDSGDRRAMRTASSYQWQVGPEGGVRRLAVEITREDDGLLAVSSLSARPAAARGAQVTVSLTQAAALDVEVLNIAGRTVARVCTERQVGAGETRLGWSGTSAAGTAVPAGMYLVRVTARAQDGQQVSAVRSLRIGQ